MSLAAMPLLYADQSPDALCLTVIEGPFDTARFQILDRAHCMAGAVQLEAGILGQSHYLALRGDAIDFTEVVACTPIEAARASRRFELRQLRGGTWRGAPGGLSGYRFHVRRRPTALRRGLAARLEARAGAARTGDQGIGLARSFPAGPDGLEARTVVWAQPTRGGILVHTLHAYPNEETSIFTRSAIRLP